MYNFAIIPDTSSDLTKELRDRFGIEDYLHGVIYYPDGRSGKASLDWDEMTPEQYYDSMKGRNVLYNTACPEGGDIYEIFEKYLKQGIDVLSITLSSGLSGTYSSCLVVAKELREKYPERKIIIIDSMRYSTSLALLVISACIKRASGATIEETAEYTEQEKYKIHQMGSMDDLFFLVKTGHVSNFKAFFGSLVGINLLADFNDKGVSEVIGKFKGKVTALEATIKYIERTIVDPENQMIFVAHTNREPAAKLLAEKIKEKFNPKEIFIVPVGMSCGASIGPGLCAAFYKGEKASENLEKEKALMDAITEELKTK